jgi:ATP-binding protein involved in chromosome partitioning
MPLREQADAGVPLTLTDPDDPAAQAIAQAARGIIAMTPISLPVFQAPAPAAAPAAPAPQAAPQPVGMSLPMA